LKNPLALDGHVQFVAGLDVIPLAVDFLNVRKAAAHPQLNSGGDLTAAGGGGAGDLLGLVHEILKIAAALFEPGGVGVGQVVGDHVDAHLLGDHARGAGPQTSDHDQSFPASLMIRPSVSS
jgi:hypothetical protein